MDNAAWSDLWLKRRRRDGVRENWFASCAVEGFGRDDRIVGNALRELEEG